MGNSTKNILIVDEDATFLDLLTTYLSVDQARYSLFKASDGKQALEVLSRENIFLMVCDTKMPGISGSQLLIEVRSRFPQIEVVLMTGCDAAELQDQIQGDGCHHILEKPFELETLRQLICSQIDKDDEGFAGTLKNIQLNDLIQICCLSAVDTGIRVTKGARQGTIYIRNGEIIHAVCGERVGEEAFYQILAWESGNFLTLGAVSVPEVTITKNSQFLVMEAARLADESSLEAEKQDHDEDTPAAVQVVSAASDDHLRLLIVDDSAMMCRALEDLLTAEGDIAIVGTAQNGAEALEKIDTLQPDLITLDVNMPVMNGRTALKHIMLKNPCPVVIISSMGSNSYTNVLEFLCLGAVDFLNKPAKNKDLSEQQRRLIKRVQQAAKAETNNFKRVKLPKILSEPKPPTQETDRKPLPCGHLVVINSGAGGLAELIRMIPLLPRDLKACIIVLQSMPPELATPLSDYLDQRSRICVQPLCTDTPLFGGHCYIGATDDPVLGENGQGEFRLIKGVTPPGAESKANHIDRFLFSLTESFAGFIQVILLSGAEIDGLDGLQRVRRQKGQIIAQQLSSCLVADPLVRAGKGRVIDCEVSTDEMVGMLLEK